MLCPRTPCATMGHKPSTLCLVYGLGVEGACSSDPGTAFVFDVTSGQHPACHQPWASRVEMGGQATLGPSGSNVAGSCLPGSPAGAVTLFLLI